jgi:CheY-like chemotaxis protein
MSSVADLHDGGLGPELRSVLLVEDDPNDVLLARRELKKLNIRNPICDVDGLDDMVAYLRGDEPYTDRAKFPLPAVIILDMLLRDSDGLEAQSWLRSNRRFRNIPLIAISSPERMARLQAAFDLGADAWLTKPFNGSDFEQLVEKLRIAVAFDGHHAAR